MKVLPVIVLNLAIVVGALVVYDHLRGDPAAPDGAVQDARGPDADLARRVDALEAARRPVLKGPDLDPRIFERLDALEAALEAQTRAASPPEVETDSGLPYRVVPKTKPGEPTKDEIKRWRRVRDAVRRQEALKKSRTLHDQALDRLSLSLTPRQREKIHEARVAFEPRVDEIWSAVKTQARETFESGGTVDHGQLVTQGFTQIQQEFAESLEGIVHAADAPAVASALFPGK